MIRDALRAVAGLDIKDANLRSIHRNSLVIASASIFVAGLESSPAWVLAIVMQLPIATSLLFIRSIEMWRGFAEEYREMVCEMLDRDDGEALSE